MSLYGRTDSNANVTKAGIGIAASSQAKTVVFVDETEAALAENKARGLNAPGWWSYVTYTDADGNTRHKAEQLVALSNADLNSNETQADDTIAADILEIITITGQPGNATTSSGLANFAVTSSVDQSGTQTFQWQRQKPDTKQWTNLSANTDTGVTYANFTTATLALSGVADDALDGYKYRVKINTSKGAAEVTSDGTAALTFGS